MIRGKSIKIKLSISSIASILVIAGLLIFMVPHFIKNVNIGDTFKVKAAENIVEPKSSKLSSQQNDSEIKKENIIEASIINPKYFFDDKLIETSDKEGLYKHGDKYLPSAIKYEDVVYVPIEFLTKNQQYSLDYDGKDIYLQNLASKNNTEEKNEPTVKDVSNSSTGTEEKDEVVNGDNDNGEDLDIIEENDTIEENIVNENDISFDDLQFYKINPYDNVDSALSQLNFDNQKVLYNGNNVFITDSVGTDTSIFMSIEKNDNDEILRMDFEDFGFKFKKINKKYRYNQPSFKSSRNISLGSKMSDVLKQYGENPVVHIEEIDPELDKDGSKTKNNLIKAFSPYLNKSEITFDMRQNVIPKNDIYNKLFYLKITYPFDSGYLTYYAVVRKNEPMKNAIVYGFDYKFDN